MSCVCIRGGGGGEGAANREVGVSCYVEVDSRCCVAFICYSVGVVCIYMYVGDCVCGEKVVVVVVVELCRRRRKMSSVYFFGCDIHCHSFSTHTCQSLL